MSSTKFRLLTVGPLPPPLCGTPVSFQVFLNEARRNEHWLHLEIVDSSPRRVKKGVGTGLALTGSNLSQAWRIIVEFTRKIRHADSILLFGSNGFAVSITPILLTICRIVRKPCYLRIFGGSLDQYFEEIPWLLRCLLLFTLRRLDGLIVQTELLHRYFRVRVGADKVHFIPSYRHLDQDIHDLSFQRRPKRGDSLKLAFFGIIKEEKGVFILLDSLQQIQDTVQCQVHCDLYGLIPPGLETRFQEALVNVKNTSYKGELEWTQVIPTLSTYDVLVHPTFYQGEGQPGVLIEAMVAGVPVITTNFRSIPELITDGVNGLLVPPNDAGALATAIENLSSDRELLQRLAKANWQKREDFDAGRVIPMLLNTAVPAGFLT